MQQRPFDIRASLKIWNEYELLSNEQYSKIILFKINLLLELMNSLHENSIKVDPWKIWCESTVYKLCYHSCSILKIFHGTELPYKHEEKDILIFDEPSMIIIFRAILENYLTFYYMYGSNESDELKQFRNLVWRYSGIKQRTEFEINSSEAKEKQKKEVEFLKTLKEEILKSELFNKYDKKAKEIILKGRKPRLFKSWPDLIKESNLNNSLFRNLYGYKSNYSHTEFISVLQIHEGGYGHKANNTKSHHIMLLLHGIICKTILELKSFFPTMESVYNSKEPMLQDEILSLANIISSSNPFLQNPDEFN